MAAVVIHELLFPRGSLNNDEVVYLGQAVSLSHGHFLLPTSSDIPWFYSAGPHGLVPKYLPTVGGWLALSQFLTGSVVPALAASAAALAFAVQRLAGQLLGPRFAVAAAAVVVLSPLTLVQSALALSYVPFLFLACCIWSLCIDLQRSGEHLARRAGLAGFLTVIAAATRPYDAVLLLGPALLITLVAMKDGRLRAAAYAVVGAVPPLVAVLVYDAYATGHALTLPFTLFSASDSIGFGPHQLYAGDPVHTFGLHQAIVGTRRLFLHQPLHWYAAGYVLIPLAVLSVLAWRSLRLASRMLLVSTLCFLVGYFFFWGPWNASIHWNGTSVVGPFYALVLLVPVALLAVGLVELHWRRLTSLPRLVHVGLVAVVAATLVVSGAQLSSAATQARTDRGITDLALADAAAAPGSVVLLGVDPAYLGHPVSALVNGTGRGRFRLLAGVDPTIAAHGPVTLMQIASYPYAPRPALDDAVTTQQTVEDSRITVRLAGSGTRAAAVVVSQGGAAPVVCRLGQLTADVTLSPGQSPRCSGSSSPTATTISRLGGQLCGSDSDCLRVSMIDGSGRPVGSRMIPFAVSADRTATVLLDGQVLRQHGAGWLLATNADR